MACSSLRLVLGLCLLVLALTTQSSAIGENTSKQILILASYNPGLRWTDSIGTTIENELSIYYPTAKFSVLRRFQSGGGQIERGSAKGSREIANGRRS